MGMILLLEIKCNGTREFHSSQHYNCIWLCLSLSVDVQQWLRPFSLLKCHHCWHLWLQWVALIFVLVLLGKFKLPCFQEIFFIIFIFNQEGCHFTMMSSMLRKCQAGWTGLKVEVFMNDNHWKMSVADCAEGSVPSPARTFVCLCSAIINNG